MDTIEKLHDYCTKLSRIVATSQNFLIPTPTHNKLGHIKKKHENCQTLGEKFLACFFFFIQCTSLVRKHYKMKSDVFSVEVIILVCLEIDVATNYNVFGISRHFCLLLMC